MLRADIDAIFQSYQQSVVDYDQSVTEFFSPTVSPYFPNFKLKTINSLERIKKKLEKNWSDDADSAAFFSVASSFLTNEANLLSAVAFFTETFADNENAFCVSLYGDLKGLIDEVLAEEICHSFLPEDSLEKRAVLTQLLDALVGVVVNKGKIEDCAKLETSINQLEEQFYSVKHARLKAIVQRALIASAMLLLLAIAVTSFFITGPLGIGIGIAAITGFMATSFFISYKAAKSNARIPKKSDIPATENKLLLTPTIKACIGLARDPNRFFNKEPATDNSITSPAPSISFPFS